MTLLAAQDGAGTYLDWGVVHISVTNLLIIVLMVVTFVAALLLPFPRGSESAPPTVPPTASRDRARRADDRGPQAG